MKSFFKPLTVIFAVVFTAAVFPSQAQSSQDTSMIVNGVCGMCERTIETAAKTLDGLESVAWNKDTKVLQVSYNPEKLSLRKISDVINQAGYDTEYNTAPDEAYYGLHKCCYYRDPKVIEDHKNEK